MLIDLILHFDNILDFEKKKFFLEFLFFFLKIFFFFFFLIIVILFLITFFIYIAVDPKRIDNLLLICNYSFLFIFLGIPCIVLKQFFDIDVEYYWYPKILKSWRLEEKRAIRIHVDSLIENPKISFERYCLNSENPYLNNPNWGPIKLIETKI